MSLRAQWKLPKEHGAWAMVSLSLALGLLVARQWSARVIFVGISVMALFIRHLVVGAATKPNRSRSGAAGSLLPGRGFLERRPAHSMASPLESHSAGPCD